MKEVWYLIITLFVLEPDGNIDEREMGAVRQQSKPACMLEVRAREELFVKYLGKDHIRRYSNLSVPYCAGGFCQPQPIDENDPNAGTYRVKLGGTLVKFSVGCENRPELTGKRIPLPETGIDNEQISPRSFP